MRRPGGEVLFNSTGERVHCHMDHVAMLFLILLRARPLIYFQIYR